MKFETRARYIGAACMIVLILIIAEVVLLGTSSSANTLTTLLLPEWQTLYTVLVVLFALGIVGGIAWIWYALTHTHQPSTYGTAHFASKKEIRQAGAARQTEAQGRESSFTLGVYGDLDIALSEEQQEGHVLIIAPTKRGKTAGIIIPNLLNERGSQSLFINDVKHELIDLTIGAVAEHHDCYIISPTRPSESNGYNPLAHVKPESISDASSVAECILRNTGNSKEPFWDNAATLLLTSAILHLRVAEPDAAFSRIADICSWSLPEVADLVTHSPSALAREVGTSFVKNASAEPKLQANIMSDMATRLLNLRDPAIKRVTSYDDLDFEQLAENPSALFLHIPPYEAARLKWLSSCLIMQLINYLFEHPHKRKFAFYLDELANAGYIPKYLDYISYIRSAGVAFLQVIQDFGQFERIYEEHGKDTILANSGTQIFLSGVGQVEAEYASRVMGETTVLARSESEEHQKVTYSEATRKLMNPDEIRSLPLWSLLVLMGHTPPFIVRNIPYFQQPELQARINLPYVQPKRVLPMLSTPPITAPPPAPPQPVTPKQQPTQSRDYEDYLTDRDMDA